MPLPQVQNDDEMPHVAVHLPESDEECDDSNGLKDDVEREIKVDESNIQHGWTFCLLLISHNPPMCLDLVLSAMKGISLSGSCIPTWAKELSEPEWDDIVKRTIQGEKLLHSKKESGWFAHDTVRAVLTSCSFPPLYRLLLLSRGIDTRMISEKIYMFKKTNLKEHGFWKKQLFGELPSRNQDGIDYAELKILADDDSCFLNAMTQCRFLPFFLVLRSCIPLCVCLMSK